MVFVSLTRHFSCLVHDDSLWDTDEFKIKHSAADSMYVDISGPLNF